MALPTSCCPILANLIALKDNLPQPFWKAVIGDAWTSSLVRVICLCNPQWKPRAPYQRHSRLATVQHVSFLQPSQCCSLAGNREVPMLFDPRWA